VFSALPWFGPRSDLNWGWTPLTWEGWAITIAFIVAVGVAFRIYGGTDKFYGVLAVSVIGLAAVCALTGTAPG
jgi:hypothetical protein